MSIDLYNSGADLALYTAQTHDLARFQADSLRRAAIHDFWSAVGRLLATGVTRSLRAVGRSAALPRLSSSGV